MAAQFVGLHMRVALRQPAGIVLTGTVRDVVAGISLTLTNVFVLGTKDWLPEMRIDASNIVDLGEVNSKKQLPVHAVPAAELAAAPVPPPHAPFMDPAIMSMGRPPAPSAAPTASDNQVLAKPEVNLDGATGTDLAAGVLKGIHVLHGQKALSHIQNAVEPVPVVDPEIESAEIESMVAKASDTEAAKTQEKRKPPGRGKRRTRRQPKEQMHDSDTAHEAPPSGRGKGWRQTPMLQSTASFQPFNSLKKNGRGRKGVSGAHEWGSEAVTEDMGEFDFENNLAKFDKNTIFEQMRKDDQIDESTRLVSHNRLPKPGTNGGKNFHYSENVLDSPVALTTKNTDFWNSEADDLNEPSVPSVLKRAVGNNLERLNGRESRAVSNIRAEGKDGVSRRSRSRIANAAATGSQPLSRVNSAQKHQEGLYIVNFNRRIEPVSTLQMINIESIAANELGFTEDLMAENAGRGIAEVAVKALSDPAMKVRFELALEASLETSTTVVLAGNNKSSIRALAAARHLHNRNFDVVVCLVGIERYSDLLEDLRRQIDLYRKFGGKVMSKNEFFEYQRKNTASGTQNPISLIIDAMLGLTISFEELRIGDQATVYELMEWANRNEAFVLAIDVPSGIDPTSGKIAIIDGNPLFVKPRYVVSIGAPKRGLLEAVTPPVDEIGLSSYAMHDEDWRLFVADMGLGSAVWKKAGTKIRRGIDFDGNWVLEMQFRALGQGSGE